MPLYIRDTRSLHCQIYLANADDPGGFMIGQLYEVTRQIHSTSFSCLRYQGITHKEGDTMIVLGIKFNDDHPTKMGWEDVHVLMNGRVGRFKIWAFKDLISTRSIKLVK